MNELAKQEMTMQFESRVLRLPKDVDYPDQDQDACRIDAPRGIAAIADGVSSGIFSRLWAGILTEAIVADMPDPENQEAFGRWLTLRREVWASQIDPTRLSWFQKPKLREGAFSTLLWVRLLPDRGSQQPGSCRLRCFAVGDSCLFHVRDGKLLRTFPIQRAAELEANPVVVGSVDLNRDQYLQFKSFEEPCWRGDLLVLCTDAVADWALRLQESGQPPDWDSYWDVPEQAWREEVMGLRNQRQMRVDDATLVLLRVTEQVVAAAPLSGPPPLPEPAEVAVPIEPLPAPGAAGQAWDEKLKSVTGQLAEEVTQQLGRGIKKLNELKQSAGSLIRKYRDKFRQDK